MKKTILIIIGLVFFLGIVALLIPVIVGMNQGYDSGILTQSLKKGCNCEVVEAKMTEADSETLVDDIKSGKFNKTFNIELSKCDYSTFEDLRNDVQSVLNEKKRCAEKTISFKVTDFKAESKTFTINDCNLNQEH